MRKAYLLLAGQESHIADDKLHTLITEAVMAESAKAVVQTEDTGFGSMIYRGLRVALTRRNAYRKTVEELRGLDPRMLKDIGIDPMEIERVADKVAAEQSRRR